MRPSKFTLLYLVFTFVLQGAMAQNLDSLELCLQNKTLSYDNKIRLYDDLSWEYLPINAEKSIAFAQKGIALAMEEDDDLMVCRLYRYIGVAHYMVNRYDTAFVYLNIAMNLAHELKDQVQSPLFLQWPKLLLIRSATGASQCCSDFQISFLRRTRPTTAQPTQPAPPMPTKNSPTV